MDRSWDQTRLWATLDQRSDAVSLQLRSFGRRHIPSIEQVLSSAGSAPTDFTLHDSGHAYRVAERMLEIIPATVTPQLSSYELLLLLLTAYLHDIGMTPELRHVRLHYQFLVTGSSQATDGPGLTKAAVAEFQEWLDNEERGVTPPLAHAAITPAQLRLADELIMYYCRHRHNDWSESWIRDYFGLEPLATYAGWLSDLVLLCRSHHMTKRELEGPAFNPRPVGNPALIVHLRYLACVLRTADILEFDPERTPDIVLRHRDVGPLSAIYWHKDHEVSIVKDQSRLSLYARPSTAAIHKALETMCNEIDVELRACWDLADQTHFEYCPGLPSTLPHRWELAPSIHRDIRPREHSYEYMDGAFRPNTRKLLQLLSGTELYGRVLMAVRELVQNAFDAVREQIAYERLANARPLDTSVVDALRALHSVSLKCEARPDGIWLICTDTGVGMTKALLQNHFLVSGQARRHDVLELERRSRRAGFELERTGQFGIGVLSYFMLADRVLLETRRSQAAGDDEGTAWIFETEGVGSFGELRAGKLPRGTRLTLRLRREVAVEVVAFVEELAAFLKTTLLHLPCRLSLDAPSPGSTVLDWRPGWRPFEKGADTLDDLVPDYGVAENLLATGVRRSRQERAEAWASARGEALSVMGTLEDKGELPDGLGRFRISLPFFNLNGGSALAFMKLVPKRARCPVLEVGGGHLVRVRTNVLMGWKGIHVEAPQWEWLDLGGRDLGAIVEVDWTSPRAGAISVDRGQLSLSGQARDAMGWLSRKKAELGLRFCHENLGSRYLALNVTIARASSVAISSPEWIVQRKSRGVASEYWDRVTFPATASEFWKYRKLPEGMRWRGQRLQVLSSINSSRLSRYGRLSLGLGVAAPDCVAPFIRWNRLSGVIGIWTKSPFSGESRRGINTANFPPSWGGLCGASLEVGTVWNHEHRVVKRVTAASWRWMRQYDLNRQDCIALRPELEEDEARWAAMLLRLTVEAPAVWEGLIGRDPPFVSELWHRAGGDGGSRHSVMCLWQGTVGTGGLRVYGQKHSRIIEVGVEDERRIARYLADWGHEWEVRGSADDEEQERTSLLRGMGRRSGQRRPHR